jgi:hypothetical protein
MRPSSSPRAAPSARSSPEAFLSRDRSTGAANTFRNCARSPSTPGQAKSKTAKNSPRSFCTGVPLRSTRFLHRSLRSAATVCVSPFAFFSLCASSQTSRSTPPVADATVSACARSVSNEVTRTRQRFCCGSAQSSNSVFASFPFSPAPLSTSSGSRRALPSHFRNSAPQLRTSDAGHTTTALRAAGDPLGPCFSSVHSSAITCSVLPMPISCASRHPKCGAPVCASRRRPQTASYMNRTPSRWCGRSASARNASTTTCARAAGTPGKTSPARDKTKAPAGGFSLGSGPTSRGCFREGTDA